MQALLCFQLVLMLGVGFGSWALSDEEFGHVLRNHEDVETRLENEDAFLTVPEIIRKYGYPVEVHEVTTEDGYVLTVHRIPYGKNSTSMVNRPVVWLQHGLLCDSSNWIMNNEDKALAYVFANLGYDVWMGNARGNTYSKKHVTYTPEDEEFWQFSWHEMGVYDVPAMIDYILTTTGQPDLYYVGHSMGTTMFFVAMAEKPELNDKIRLMSALAPVTFVEYAETPLMYIAPFVNQIEWILEMMGLHEFMPSSALMELLGQTICRVSSPVSGLCHNVLFLIAGYNSDQLNTTAVPIILGHTPAGSSTKSVVHYAQLRNSGIFRQLDLGRRTNLEVYGQEQPPEYDFSNIRVPVAVYWGENDWLASPRDVQHLTEMLPNLVKKYKIRHDNYNHLDFLWAMDNNVLINDEIVTFLQRY